MKKNKHLLLWSSLGVSSLLVVAAAQENFFKQWRSIQAATKSDAGPIDIRLRQIVVPGLKVTDRCVTCHVGMAPGEQGLAGPNVVAAHKAVGHDPAEYGCAVCHGGQGRATEKADAHGDVHFWPEPMIPSRFAYAGCGSCHTHLSVPHPAQMARGKGLLERLDCMACHRLNGRGGTLRPHGTGGMEGPDLSRIGAHGIDPQWYATHLEKAKAAKDGSWKSSFGPIGESDRAAIEVYLGSQVGAPGLVEAKAMFHSLGCNGCHKVGGVGGDDGPDLTLEGKKDPGRLDFRHVRGEHTLVNWLAEHFRRPADVVPGSQMPNFGLSEEQVELLTYYMLSLRQSNLPEAYWPKDRVRAMRFGEREFATDGETLFGTFCAACHGANGEGRRYPGMPVFPAVGNADFLAVASDQFLAETIRKGRPGRRMPAWGAKDGGLRPAEIANIVAFLRDGHHVPMVGGQKEPLPQHAARRWVKADPAQGQRIYGNYCAGCHGAKGQGIEAPPLANKGLLAAASDDYFVGTIGRGRRGTAMQSFANPSTVHPALSPADIEAIVAFIRTWEEP
jgi:mono/diheme cytochrome c family protein